MQESSIAQIQGENRRLRAEPHQDDREDRAHEGRPSASASFPVSRPKSGRIAIDGGGAKGYGEKVVLQRSGMHTSEAMPSRRRPQRAGKIDVMSLLSRRIARLGTRTEGHQVVMQSSRRKKRASRSAAHRLRDALGDCPDTMIGYQKMLGGFVIGSDVSRRVGVSEASDAARRRGMLLRLRIHVLDSRQPSIDSKAVLTRRLATRRHARRVARFAIRRAAATGSSRLGGKAFYTRTYPSTWSKHSVAPARASKKPNGQPRTGTGRTSIASATELRRQAREGYKGFARDKDLEAHRQREQASGTGETMAATGFRRARQAKP